MVGRRGEAPLVPPYILCNFKLDGAVGVPSSTGGCLPVPSLPEDGRERGPETATTDSRLCQFHS